MTRFLAVLTVRDEAAFLLEWLAHHRRVGFTDFLVFSNDCSDGTDAMLDRLAAIGQLTHVRNDRHDDGGVQWAALKQADKHPLVKQADWILPLDVDEFVNIKIGDGTLTALLDHLPEATAIPLTWRLFGNAGVVDYVDTPILQQFTRAAPIPCYWPWKAAMFKTLYRNDGTYQKMGVHRPRNIDADKIGQARWFDGSGRELPATYHRQKIFSNFFQDNCQIAQLNHYPLGAMQSFVVKRARGRAVHPDQVLGMDYWVERNFNQVEDTSILRHWDQITAERDTLLADDELARLHAEGVAWRHDRFDRLMLEDGYRALFGQLQATPPTHCLSPEQAERIMQYGRQAQAQGRRAS